MKKLFATICVLALSGCVSSSNFAASGNYISIKDYLTRSDSFESTVNPIAPTAFFILDSSNKGRNKKMCKAFRQLPTAEEAGVIDPTATQATTWWLLRDDIADKNDCKQMVNNYDYARADNLRSKFNLPEDAHQVLVAVDSEGDYFYFDLTRANRGQREDFLIKWFTAASGLSADGVSLKVRSNKFFDRLGHILEDGAGKVKKCANDSNVSESGSVLTKAPASTVDPQDSNFIDKAVALIGGYTVPVVGFKVCEIANVVL